MKEGPQKRKEVLKNERRSSGTKEDPLERKKVLMNERRSSNEKRI